MSQYKLNRILATSKTFNGPKSYLTIFIGQISNSTMVNEPIHCSVKNQSTNVEK